MFCSHYPACGMPCDISNHQPHSSPPSSWARRTTKPSYCTLTHIYQASRHPKQDQVPKPGTMLCDDAAPASAEYFNEKLISRDRNIQNTLRRQWVDFRHDFRLDSSSRRPVTMKLQYRTNQSTDSPIGTSQALVVNVLRRGNNLE